MDEILMIKILKSLGVISSVLALVLGLDLLVGAKVTASLKRSLERNIDFDKLLLNTQHRRWLGMLLLFIGVVIIVTLATH